MSVWLTYVLLMPQELNLPPEVGRISAEVQMDIAQALEQQNCLQAEIDLFSHRCRQFVYAAHGCALRADKLAAEREAIRTRVSKSVQGIVDKSCKSSSAGGKFFSTLLANVT
jgi:hypothetical protein